MNPEKQIPLPEALQPAPELQAGSQQQERVHDVFDELGYFDAEHSVIADQQEVEQSYFSLENNVSERLPRLHRAWQGARSVVKGIGQRLSIEADGQKLSAGENIRARLFNGTLIPLARTAKYEIPLNETMFGRSNPVIDKAVRNRTNTAYSKADYAKLAAFEVVTLTPVRALGTMAIGGAANLTLHFSAEGGRLHAGATKAREMSDNWLNAYDKGEHNPTISRKQRAATKIAELEFSNRKSDVFDPDYDPRWRDRR